MPEVQSFSLRADQTVPAAAVDALNRDGVVCIRGAFDQDWLALIEQGIDLAHTGASTDLDIFKRDEDAGSFFMSSGAWKKIAPFHRFIFESHISDLAWSMLDTTEPSQFLLQPIETDHVGALIDVPRLWPAYDEVVQGEVCLRPRPPSDIVPPRL